MEKTKEAIERRRIRQNKRYHEKMKDPVWAEQQKIRRRLLARKLRDNDLEGTREKERKRRKKYRNKRTCSFKYLARVTVRKAIQNGTLVRPKCCPECNDSKNHIEAHHPDYFRPLKIEWSCSLCHGKKHRIK